MCRSPCGVNRPGSSARPYLLPLLVGPLDRTAQDAVANVAGELPCALRRWEHEVLRARRLDLVTSGLI